MSKFLKIVGIYIIYLLLTLIIFYITGLYIWTTPPTRVVLGRIIGLPFILTISTSVFIKIINKLKK